MIAIALAYYSLSLHCRYPYYCPLSGYCESKGGVMRVNAIAISTNKIGLSRFIVFDFNQQDDGDRTIHYKSDRAVGYASVA